MGRFRSFRASGQVDEISRQQTPLFHVVPAEQRLGADHAPAPQVEDRLILEQELADADALTDPLLPGMK